jgi:hypothetical protein
MNKTALINDTGVSRPILRTASGFLLLLLCGVAIASASSLRGFPFLPLVVSTVPANGDQNPYGVAFVPSGFPGPNLRPGDILVSNFNDGGNRQGFGTTIIRVRSDGQTSVFANTGSVTGLTAALGIIKQGFVFVGSVATADGTDSNVTGGPLLVLDSKGNAVQSITSPLDGPWGLAINSRDDDHVQVFVSSVLDGTVTRFDFSFPGNMIHLDGSTQIASGYSHTLDPLAIVIGPAGMAYDRRKDILYVAGEDDDKIFAIQEASTTTDHGTGDVVFSDTTHLHGPLGLAIAPNGNLITANNDSINSDPNQPSEIVEFTVTGNFVRQFSIDPNIDGPFAIAIGKFDDANEFAYLNDNRNTLSVLRLAD